jgi:hypothetical protein
MDSYGIYNTMSFKIRRILKFLFLFYFVVYALSPLCYPFTQTKEAVLVSKETKTDFQDIRLFLWQTVWQKVIPQEESSDNTGDICFIRKTRAILGSDHVIKMKEYSASSEHTFVLPTTQLCMTLVFNLVLPHRVFYPFLSGLSPPAV